METLISESPAPLLSAIRLGAAPAGRPEAEGAADAARVRAAAARFAAGDDIFAAAARRAAARARGE